MIERDPLDLKVLKRLVRAKKARKHVTDFCQFVSPDPNDPSDSDKSLYQVKKHHEVVGAAIEAVAEGTIKRLIISIPPRHGKTDECCVKGIPWYLGKFSNRSVIYATYNEDVALDKGAEARDIINSAAYRQVFPQVKLVKGGKASGKLKTENKNHVFFVGRGGTITGRGGHLIIVDDLFKNDEEADSAAIRNKVWKWFTGTVMNRFMTDEGAMILIMTRWHEDDVIGRLTDPNNEYYDAERAAKWHVVNLPAIAEEGDLLGRPVGEALWPERFGIDYLNEQKSLDERRFSCLYQGNPTPDEGIFFKREFFKYYNPETLDISKLRIYGSCDLSVGTKKQKVGGKQSDRSCLFIWGVDLSDNIYLIHADINRDSSDKNVEKMIDLMLEHKPITWFTYQDQITGSIGPFLYKRMQERLCYTTTIEEHSSNGSKEQKAQSFRARMAMGKVFFPANRQTTRIIVEEYIAFPNGRNDDCVDTGALFGQNLDNILTGKRADPTIREEAVPGTIKWILESEKLLKALKAKEENGGF